MILRAIESPLPQTSDANPRPIWDVLFEHQTKLNGSNECWMITQPSHSALSGEIAAALDPKVFGKFDEATVRAIALHDAGWSAFDSDLIRASRESRSGQTKAAISFLGAPPKEAVAAWTASVETALKADLLGGLLVSEHFRSIAQFQVDENQAKASAMAAFVQQEEARQKKLRPKIALESAIIERQVDGLRFTDLVSLYLCAGLTEPVILPQQFQQHNFVMATTDQGIHRLQPFPFPTDQTYSVAALRHPRTKSVSSSTFLCKITG